MSFVTIAIFVAGVLLGFMIARLLKSRAGQNIFADEIEADIMREKASLAVNERIERRKNRIMAVAKAEGKITNDAVEELYCISDRTASSYLNQLAKDNKLQKHGAGRGTYYTPTEMMI